MTFPKGPEGCLAGIVLTALALLFLIGCLRRADEPVPIFLHDLEADNRNAADRFATAFALNPSCHGLVLFRSSKMVPGTTSYWALDTWQEGEDGLSWSIMHRFDNTGLVNGSDKSAAEAASHVCAIARSAGGQVR